MSNTAKVIIENVPAFASGVKAVCKGLSALMIGAGVTFAAISLGDYYNKKADNISNSYNRCRPTYRDFYGGQKVEDVDEEE